MRYYWAALSLWRGAVINGQAKGTAQKNSADGHIKIYVTVYI